MLSGPGTTPVDRNPLHNCTEVQANVFFTIRLELCQNMQPISDICKDYKTITNK